MTDCPNCHKLRNEIAALEERVKPLSGLDLPALLEAVREFMRGDIGDVGLFRKLKSLGIGGEEVRK